MNDSDKHRYKNSMKIDILIVSLKEYTAYSLSVSAVEILFASNFSMLKQESSWQRVRYQLEVDIN